MSAVLDQVVEFQVGNSLESGTIQNSCPICRGHIDGQDITKVGNTFCCTVCVNRVYEAAQSHDMLVTYLWRGTPPQIADVYLSPKPSWMR